MSFVTVPAEYSNWVIKTFEKVREKPVRVMVTFEYKEENNSILKKRMNDFKKWENIFDMSDLNAVMKKRWVIK